MQGPVLAFGLLETSSSLCVYAVGLMSKLLALRLLKHHLTKIVALIRQTPREYSDVSIHGHTVRAYPAGMAGEVGSQTIALVATFLVSVLVNCSLGRDTYQLLSR